MGRGPKRRIHYLPITENTDASIHFREDPKCIAACDHLIDVVDETMMKNSLAGMPACWTPGAGRYMISFADAPAAVQLYLFLLGQLAESVEECLGSDAEVCLKAFGRSMDLAWAGASEEMCLLPGMELPVRDKLFELLE